MVLTRTYKANIAKSTHANLEEFVKFYCASQRSIYARLYNAFQNFFRRVKRGEKPGFPRFKGKSRLVRSFDVPAPIRIKRQGKYHVLNIKGVGKFRFKGEIDGEVRVARIIKTPLRIKVQLILEKEIPVQEDSRAPLGIDVGVKSRLTLSNGAQIEGSNNRRKLIAQKQKEEQRIAEAEIGKLHELTELN